MVTQPELAGQIKNQYMGGLRVLYDHILRLRMVKYNKSDTLWNVNINVPAKSMKGIMKFYNPKIDKVEVMMEGIPNQLYAHGERV